VYIYFFHKYNFFFNVSHRNAIIIQIDYLQFNLETNPFNNVISQKINLAPWVKPDLVISLKTVSDSSNIFTATSGQPFTVRLINTNIGPGAIDPKKIWRNVINFSPQPFNLSNNSDPGGNCTQSYLCESDFGSCPCSAVGSSVEIGPMAAGDSIVRNITITLPSNTPSGTYYLIATTNTQDQICEKDNTNNQVSYAVIVHRPEPADLIVKNVYHPDSIDVGKPFTVSWTVKNQGVSPAAGYMREAAYLSTDAQWSDDDILLGFTDGIINPELNPGMQIQRSITTKVSNAAIQDYYVIVRTDLLDNIWETTNENNSASSIKQMSLRIPTLPIGQDVQAILRDNVPLYYRLDTKPQHLGQTILVTITTPDSVQANNQLYLRHGILPTLQDFDFRSERLGFGNQEAAIPTVENVPYYLMVDGAKGFGKDSQLVVLKASILPFSIRSVDATKGGNTGYATVLLKGAKFSQQMQVFLQRDTVIIPTDSLGVVNGTKAFARFNLAGKPLGCKPPTNPILLGV
jgi:hypothetical protein